MPDVITRKGDPTEQIIDVVKKTLLEQIEDLTRRKFTGTLSLRLECVFNQGGLRNVRKKVGQEEVIQKGDNGTNNQTQPNM